ncbi:MAG: hypothetical protein WBB28_14665 [Crinalium sp.]
MNVATKEESSNSSGISYRLSFLSLTSSLAITIPTSSRVIEAILHLKYFAD